MSHSFFKFTLLLTLIMFTACKLEEPFNEAEQFEKDVDIIRDYLKKNNIDADELSTSGIFIHWTHKDSTQLNQPNFLLYDDSITIINLGYKGYLTNGIVFDQSPADSTTRLELENLIRGWQIAIPQMSAGDSATLLIPSFHGYKNYSKGIIPPNSVLLFDVYLESFYNKKLQ